VRWDPLLDGTVLAEGREVNTIAYRYRTRRAALRGVVAATLPPDGSLWREEYQGGSGSGSEIDGGQGSLEAPSLPTHEVLPRADPRSFASAPEALWRPSSGALGSRRALGRLVGGSWELVSAPPDTYHGVLWLVDGSLLLHPEALASIRVR
jgi:hypothetical protein